MEDGEKIDVGAAVKDTIGRIKSTANILKSNAGVFRSLNYGFLIPFKKIFSFDIFRKKAVRWVLFLGLTPLIIWNFADFLKTGFTATLWLLLIYFCCFWALYFHNLIQPRKDVWGRAILFALFTIIIGIPIDYLLQKFPVIHQLYNGTESQYFIFRFVGFIFGVGVVEETCKALPLLIYCCLFKKSITLRDALFLGFISGLGFAAAEGVRYSFEEIDYGARAQNLQLVFRMMSNPVLHGAWAGTVGWFIAVASNKPLKWPIIVVGIFFMAVLHGLNDVFSDSLAHILIAAFSITIFMTYLVHDEETQSSSEIPASNNL